LSVEGFASKRRMEHMHIKTQSRAIVATLAAALALTAVDMRPVAAAAVAPQTAETAKIQASDATEFSSQRRHYRHGGYRNGGAVAAGAIIGAAAGLAIAGSAGRNYYGNSYYDYGYSEPSYGYAEPYAYAPAPYYGSGSYGPRNEYFPN
jgi:hypothetical protein